MGKTAKYAWHKSKPSNKKKTTSWSKDDDPGFYARTKWRKLREYLLSLKPLCVYCELEDCVEPAIFLDHIVPRRVKKDWEYFHNNLQGLCEYHHNFKTNYESRGLVDPITSKLYGITSLGNTGTITDEIEEHE